jgi:hypothetical protein
VDQFPLPRSHIRTRIEEEREGKAHLSARTLNYQDGRSTTRANINLSRGGEKALGNKDYPPRVPPQHKTSKP